MGTRSRPPGPARAAARRCRSTAVALIAGAAAWFALLPPAQARADGASSTAGSTAESAPSARAAAAPQAAPPGPRTDGPYLPLHEPLERYEQADVAVQSGTRRHTFQAWIADTPERREQGLMWVRQLPANRGMLFIFDRPQPVSFWMKNTYVTLDLIFVAPDGRIIRVAENAAPQSLQNIDSMGVVRGVLEVRGGTARRLGIKPGDRLLHPAFVAH